MSGSFHPEVWLTTAKRLPVGTTTRQPHRGDRTTRANLIIGHDAGKYWCYCQSCKRGAVHEKTHVSVVGAHAPPQSADLSLPTDMVKLYDLDEFSRQAIQNFLVRKHVDPLFLPELWFSESRKRLLIDTRSGWLGRDLTDTSHQKWLTYNHTMFLGPDRPEYGRCAVVVEDPFSFYKVRWALRASSEYDVYCALGTRVRPALALELAERVRATAFLDGDGAGYRGADEMRRHLRAYGTRVSAACAPAGLDPKDMTAQEIRDHVEHAG